MVAQFGKCTSGLVSDTPGVKPTSGRNRQTVQYPKIESNAQNDNAFNAQLGIEGPADSTDLPPRSPASLASTRPAARRATSASSPATGSIAFLPKAVRPSAYFFRMKIFSAVSLVAALAATTLAHGAPAASIKPPVKQPAQASRFLTIHGVHYLTGASPVQPTAKPLADAPQFVTIHGVHY